MKFMLHAVQQALANILRNKMVNFLCLGIIAFTLLVPGIFNYISFNLERYISKLSENVEAIFYLKDDSDGGAIEKLLQRIQAQPAGQGGRLHLQGPGADRISPANSPN